MKKRVKINGEYYWLQLSVSKLENGTETPLGREATERLLEDQHLLVLSDDELTRDVEALRFWNEEHEKRLRERLLALGVEGKR